MTHLHCERATRGRAVTAVVMAASIAACGRTGLGVAGSNDGSGRTGDPASGPGGSGAGGAPAASTGVAGAMVSSSSTGPSIMCTPGAVSACYTGDPSTEGVASCKAGTHVCAPDGLSFGPCEGQVLPTFEDCATPDDEDCNPTTTGCGPAWTQIASHDLYPIGAAVDLAGGVIVLGVLAGEADLGGGVVLSAPDTTDLAIVRYDPDGELVWAKQFPTDATNASALGSVALSGADILIAAGVHGAIDLGQGPIAGDGGIVAKLDANGDVVWAKRTSDPHARLALDAQGNVHVISWCNDFPSWPCSPGAHVMKLGADAAALWERGFGAAERLDPFGVAVDSQGNVVLGGMFYVELDVGTGPISADPVAGGAFVAKLDASGNTLWAHGFGDQIDEGEDLLIFPYVFGQPFVSGWLYATSYAGAYALALAPNDDILVAGKMNDTLHLGGAPISSPHQGLFLARFGPGGDHLWSRAVGAPIFETPPAITVAPSGDVVVVAREGLNPWGPVNAVGFDFGGGLLPDGLAVARLDAAGQHIASTSYVSGRQDSWPTAVATPNAIYVVGWSGKDLSIGAVQGTGMYVAKLVPGP